MFTRPRFRRACAAPAFAAAALIAPGSDADPAPGGWRDIITLNAVVRDFRPFIENGGHEDFQRFYSGYPRMGLVTEHLGTDGRPQLASRFGDWRVAQYADLEGRPVRPQLVIDGVVPGTEGQLVPADAASIWSAASFEGWFRDVPGVNLSTIVPLALVETSPGSGDYVFDAATPDADYNPLFVDLPIPGFFPINDRLYGNFAGFDGGSTNFHFTTEIAASFVHAAGTDRSFTFRGDDDVWVFINGRLVIELGGIHGADEQTIDLDELDWLTDGQRCSLHLFHAQRRTAQSNFRIQTTVPLRSFSSVMVADAFD
jgi:fibro-slime domain-containing protein